MSYRRSRRGVLPPWTRTHPAYRSWLLCRYRAALQPPPPPTRPASPRPETGTCESWRPSAQPIRSESSKSLYRGRLRPTAYDRHLAATQHRQCPGPPRVNRTTLVECGLCTQTPRWSGAGSYRRDSRRGKTQAARPRRTRAAVRTSSREIPNSSATTSPGSPALSIAATSATRGPAVPKRGWPNP